MLAPRSRRHLFGQLHLEQTYYPSGRYRLTMSGIFFSRSSLMAICNGSVSPSKSTSTGAFMLFDILLALVRLRTTPAHSSSPSKDIAYLICKARVPRIRARSYFVMYGVVLRSSSGILLSRLDLSFPELAAAEGSPEMTMLSSSPFSMSSSPSSPTSGSK